MTQTNDTQVSRREVFEMIGTGAASLVAASTFGISQAWAESAPAPKVAGPAFAQEFTPKPLPFNPSKLKGISEKLIVSHHDNNYAGAIKALNTVRKKLAEAMGQADLPPYVYNGLKREQLARSGSMILHEFYFGNLGGNGKAGNSLKAKIAQSFGSFEAWESETRRIALGLAGGSGWIILGRNLHTGLLENQIAFDHTQGLPTTMPILVMDMYEHAFQMDYGAAAAKYIDAFFENIQYEAVETRLQKADAL